MKISTFTYKGIDVDVSYNNKNIAYTFEKDGNTYGGKVKLEKRGIMDIVSATFLLLLNALETHEALCKSKTSKQSLKSSTPDSQ